MTGLISFCRSEILDTPILELLHTAQFQYDSKSNVASKGNLAASSWQRLERSASYTVHPQGTAPPALRTRRPIVRWTVGGSVRSPAKSANGERTQTDADRPLHHCIPPPAIAAKQSFRPETPCGSALSGRNLVPHSFIFRRSELSFSARRWNSRRSYQSAAKVDRFWQLGKGAKNNSKNEKERVLSESVNSRKRQSAAASQRRGESAAST